MKKFNEWLTEAEEPLYVFAEGFKFWIPLRKVMFKVNEDIAKMGYRPVGQPQYDIKRVRVVMKNRNDYDHEVVGITQKYKCGGTELSVCVTTFDEKTNIVEFAVYPHAGSDDEMDAQVFAETFSKKYFGVKPSKYSDRSWQCRLGNREQVFRKTSSWKH